MKKLWLWAFLVSAVAMTSCSNSDFSSQSGKGYVIAYDPTFTPANIQGESSQVIGFTRDILKAIATKQGLRLKVAEVGSENLFAGLQSGEYDAIITSLPIVPTNEQIFSVSNRYLYTGPVLITQNNSDIHNITDLNNRFVGINAFASESTIISKYPLILLTYFPNNALALQALLQNKVNAVLMDALEAYQYCENIYHGQIHLIDHPITNDGLHLLSLKDRQKNLFEQFNRGLEEIKHSGMYKTLLSKWQLQPCQ